MKKTSAALRLGARAVVQKRSALETLIAAIQTAVGGFVSSPPTAHVEFKRGSERPAINPLTARESAIVRHVAEGLHNAEVAERLSITEVL